jgi:hemerythrin
MALLNWTSEYSVGVDSIDKQHQKLFDMLNELHDAMKLGKGGQVAPIVLKSLVQYTRQHFADEERMMLRANYPEFARHKAEHDKLTADVVQMVHDFEAGKIPLSMKLLDFLRQWLQKHINDADKRYTASMLAAGIH